MKKRIIILIVTVVLVCITGIAISSRKRDTENSTDKVVVTSCDSIPNDAESVSAVSNSMAKVKTEEEVMAQADCIVSGTVIGREYKKITANNKETYKTIIKYQVDKVLKGEVSLSEITVMLPYNIGESVKVSEGEYFEQLNEGAKAILFISPNEEDDCFNLGDTQILKSLVAQYSYSGGWQDIILENEERIVYNEKIYQHFSDMQRFDEIVQYIKNLSCN